MGLKKPILSVQAKFIDSVLLSTGPNLYILCWNFFIFDVVIIHAQAPCSSFTAPSKAPNKCSF